MILFKKIIEKSYTWDLACAQVLVHDVAHFLDIDSHVAACGRNSLEMVHIGVTPFITIIFNNYFHQLRRNRRAMAQYFKMGAVMNELPVGSTVQRSNL